MLSLAVTQEQIIMGRSDLVEDRQAIYGKSSRLKVQVTRCGRCRIGRLQSSTTGDADPATSGSHKDEKKLSGTSLGDRLRRAS